MAETPTMFDLRKLANRMSKVSTEIRRTLRPVREGGTTNVLAMRLVRQEAAKLVRADDPRVPKDLRVELLEFVARHGSRVQGSVPVAQVRQQVYLTQDEHDLIERAARNQKISMSAFFRESAVKHARATLGVTE